MNKKFVYQVGNNKKVLTSSFWLSFTDFSLLLSWYLHLVVVEELEYPSNLESYAVGSLATGRATLGGQVEG